MKIISDKIGRSSAIRLLVVGLLAGFANGLLGAGGGILIVFGMTPLLSADREGQRDVFANALAVMMPVSIVSVISYILAGRFDSTPFSLYLLPAVAGGLIGGFLLDRLKLPLIKRLFALIVIWSGLYMIF